MWPAVANEGPGVKSATLIVVDRSGSTPKVLLGRRNANLKFMAGKFVFPGGRLEPGDKRMPVASELDTHAEARLMRNVQRPTRDRAHLSVRQRRRGNGCISRAKARKRLNGLACEGRKDFPKCCDRQLRQ